MKEIQERLEKLREVMRREGLFAFIFPSTDPHQSEYVADRWKGREWISGFDGSAGTAVVTLHHAALWTDSRYFLAAAEELKDREYQLMKLKVADTPTIAEWLGKISVEEHEGTEVAIDGRCASESLVEALQKDLRTHGGLTLRLNLNPLEQIWADRPTVPRGIIGVHPLCYAGESCSDKLERIRRALRERHCDGMLMSALDDIAWTLNLRGHDVHCNPVFIAYLVVEPETTTLFIYRDKIPADVRAYLQEQKIMVKDYDAVADYLRKDYFHYNILMDPDETNSYLVAAARKGRAEVELLSSPVPAMKAVKNATEIEGYRKAMLRDGIAMVQFLRWLRPAVAKGGQTELSVSRKLESLRACQDLYQDISFDTISGYAAHGAIVHYEPTEESDVPLEPKGFLLLDSGAQYLDGTTDITRTIPLGPLTDEERLVYTYVLKAHIQLELAVFPDGACGTQIDALAREPLWRAGLNFLHGTGHGVGSYLNVHEGPHQIRMEYMPAPLHAGMTVTDEPGIYVDGRFGVRIENTLLIVPDQTTAFGSFLKMEPLTLCPIDTEPVILTLLTEEERMWLNAYHRLVLEVLAPYVEGEDLQWLKTATREI